ncbi:hypothetical protein COCON_G00211630 [Conger conger]|uniref:Uncharacterized protein n=1 Tax=Conger conger TaxID=82655 RepID=A0A9Q1D0Y7_CONCO|nr:hypothetical protein COCON_G00211630 [Conger conger]
MRAALEVEKNKSQFCAPDPSHCKHWYSRCLQWSLTGENTVGWARIGVLGAPRSASAMSPTRRSLLDLWAENRRTRVEDPKEHLTARLRKLSLRADRGLVTSIARQNEKRSRLLPPAGGGVFRQLSPESLAELHQQTVQKEVEKKKKVKVCKADRPKPSRELEAGQILPFVFGEPPAELLGTPLEELDPFHQAQKTFIVITKGGRIFRFNAESACYLLSPLNIVRRAAVRVVVHSYPPFSECESRCFTPETSRLHIRHPIVLQCKR